MTYYGMGLNYLNSFSAVPVENTADPAIACTFPREKTQLHKVVVIMTATKNNYRDLGPN